MKLIKHIYSISWKILIFWAVILLLFHLGISNLSDLVARKSKVEETISSDVLLGEVMGDRNALCRLAFHYVNKEDPNSGDLEKARHYYTLASDKGHSTASNNLGVFFEKGQAGVAKNHEIALELYQKSAKAGGGYGYGNWARFQEKGLGGLEKDLATAAPLRMKAAQLGHPDSQYLVGLYHHQGDYGFPVDHEKATQWLTKSANQGDVDAKALLAHFTNVAAN